MPSPPLRNAWTGAAILSAAFAARTLAQLPADDPAHHDDQFHCPPAPVDPLDFREAVAWIVYPRFGLIVPVLEGTSEEVLRRGAGLVAGTALPGVPDRRRNSVIAAHRTSFFSPLESAVLGDRVTLVTGAGAEEFVVDRILTVTPEHIELEEPTRRRRLTLVTCTPFNYLGSAPDRWVVIATPLSAAAPGKGRRAGTARGRQRKGRPSGVPNPSSRENAQR